MPAYESFAMFYDIFTRDVDYKARTEYLLGLFEKYSQRPKLLLDLACGTGGFSAEFARKGISVIGVDISSEMLSCARQKSIEEGLDILYLNQPAEQLELYGTVDGAVCCLDSLNHITDYDNFCKAIAKTALFLEKDCLFIFDVNTEYKHSCVLGNNTFVLEDEGVFCCWQNEYSSEEKKTYINIDFFAENQDGSYERFSESFCERAYTAAEIGQALNAAGLRIEAVLAENTEEAPSSATQRSIYVTRRV